MTEATPTVALVHGAFAESASWNGVIGQLRASGVSSVAIGNPLRSLAGDAAYVRDRVAGIGGPVVLVGHSYGGMVITEAAARNDDVVGLVYVAAFAPDTGESAFGLSTMFPGSSLGDALAPCPLSNGEVDLLITRERFRDQFAADVTAPEAGLLWATQRPATQTALTDALPTDHPAWKDTPSWFVVSELDRNIPAQLQRFCAERAGAKGLREVPGASHAVAISNPQPVAATILDACGSR